MTEKYSWIPTYGELVKYLKSKENNQKELIELLKSVNISPFNDISKEGNEFDIELGEIDPFTFFSYINKYGSKRRVEILQNLSRNIDLPVPNDDLGIPTSQAQKVWMFPFKYLRVNNEINRLWNFFYKVLDNTITNEDFQDILSIKNIATRKLTEALFYVNPEKYLPINGPTISYIEQELGIESKFNTYDEYLELLDTIKTKTNTPFYQLSHEAWEWKRKEKDDKKILEVIETYKLRLKDKLAFKYEKYKWELIEKYKGRPKHTDDNLAKDISDIDYSNLIYHMATATIKEMAHKSPTEYHSLLAQLFDESIPLNERIKEFRKGADNIYGNLHTNKKLSSHHDERTISAILTYHNPDKYTFYKYSYYKKFCALMNVKTKSALKRYSHYLDMLQVFVDQYINEDIELLELMSEVKTDKCYADSNNLLLAQSILYESLDVWQSTPNYWIFQGSPKVFDFESAIRENNINNWTTSNFKDTIKPGDKVILWLVGDKAGCYALADITHAPRYIDKSADDENWTVEHSAKNEMKAGIKITHNLIDNPILKEEIENVENLKDLKVGNQGTNFKATKQEYETILEMAKSKEKQSEHTQFWLYTPGRKASMWDEFYSKGIMGLGWDEIGDLKQYRSQQEIVTALNELDNIETSKKNDSLANYEFLNKINIGDVIIAKQGTTEYLGYGIVTSDYYYDNERLSYKKCRKVNWKNRGRWEDKDIVVKTLTNITNLDDYVKRLIQLLNINLDDNKIDTVLKPNLRLNQILYGPPGTGKTYNTKNIAVEIIKGKKNRTRQEINDEYTELVKANQIVFTTFHQSLSYEDFIEGIKPETIDGTINYEIKDGIFKKFCLSANPKNTDSFESAYDKLLDELRKEEYIKLKTSYNMSDFAVSLNRNGNLNLLTGDDMKHNGVLTKERLILRLNNEDSIKYWQGYYDGVINYMTEKLNFKPTLKNENKNFVFIIDEINRGNIPAIFGELITLLEEDKRKGNNEQIEVTLPYSNEKFSIPNNVYVIGTMNTADRSVEALDTALRRRFSFLEIPSQPELISSVGELREGDGIVEDINLVVLLKTINKRIEKLLSKDHHIGHSYFLKVANLKDLKSIFQNNIVPLLQEYFFGDYGKIGLILGENFFEPVELDNDYIFAPFNGYDGYGLSDRPIYNIKNIEEMNDEEFQTAINFLLNGQSV